MKEKVRQIMIKGGYSALIAVAAMALYLLAMYFANKYFDSITKPAEITVNEAGEIFIQGFGKEKDETIYILWETDGGSIKPVSENKVFAAQNTNDNNKWYCVNTDISEGIKWDSADADGNEYDTATVRAVIYSYDSSKNKDPYYMGGYLNEMTITVTKTDGRVVKAEDNRYFSNPVRADSDSNWSQIYMVNEDENGKTYRFRTGKSIDDDMLILIWESDNNILSETDYEKGMYYCDIIDENKDKNIIIAKNTVTVSRDKTEGVAVRAYLIDEETYKDYNDGKQINEDEKLYMAELKDD